MGSSDKNKNKRFSDKRNVLSAKLVFFDLAENVIDRVRGRTSEKDKGIMMLERIENRFGITEIDKNAFKLKMIEMQEKAFTPTVVPESMRDKQVQWTRDAKGNIVSPFASKKKLIDEPIKKDLK